MVHTLLSVYLTVITLLLLMVTVALVLSGLFAFAVLIYIMFRGEE